MSKEKNEVKAEISPTVAPAPAPPVARVVVKKFRVSVDGESHVYEADSALEAWAKHNDKNKAHHSIKQKNPVIEEVK